MIDNENSIQNALVTNTSVTAGDASDGERKDGAVGGSAGGLAVTSSGTISQSHVAGTTVTAGDGGYGEGSGSGSATGNGGDGGVAGGLVSKNLGTVEEVAVTNTTVTGGDGGIGNGGGGGESEGVGGNGGDGGGLAADNDGTVRDTYVTGIDITAGDGGDGERGGGGDSLAYGGDGGDSGGLLALNTDTATDGYVGSATITEGAGGSGDNNGDSGTPGAFVVVNQRSVDGYWNEDETNVGVTDAGTGLTTTEMQGSSATSNMGGFDFSGTWETVENSEGDTTGDSYPILQSVDRQAQLEAQNVNAYAGGDGTASNPYEIANWYHLDNVSGNLDGNFTLVVDLNETTAGYDAVARETANSDKGFDPIGDSGTPFTGTFDGNGHTISGLSIDRGDDVGLFGETETGSSMTDVTLESPDVIGEHDVGPLVGASYGDITEGTVDGGDVTTDIGTDEEAHVGGLVGTIYDGTIERSTTSITIDADGNDEVGGLSGDMAGEGTVRESSATSDVTNGGEKIGGLLGDANADATITESFATGSLDGDGSIGGLVGREDGGSVDVSDSYWDTEATGEDETAGDGTGLTTDEMQGRSAIDELSGLDFDSVWWMTTHDDDYPRLRALDAGLDITIDETNEPVTEGETLTVDVTIDNTGSSERTQDVTLDIEGEDEAQDEEEVTVDGGTSEEITLEWETASGLADDYDVEVVTDDAIDTDKIEVEQRYEIDASDGDETTGPGESVTVDPDLSLSGPGEDLEDARVVLQNKKDGDELSVDTSGTDITDDGYNAYTGVLKLSGTASVSDYESVLRTVEFENTEDAGSTDTADRDISFSLGDSLPSGDTEHYYEYVEDDAIRWDDARDAAADEDYFGLTGYLVTVTSQKENDFVADKLEGQGWIGASDADQEEEWRWKTGPEGTEDGGDGRHFFDQNGEGGSAVGDEYENWNDGEPNDDGGEDYAHYRTDGTWNDYAIDNGNIDGYVVEYGGLDGDPDVQLQDTKTVEIEQADLRTYDVDGPDDGPFATGDTVEYEFTVENGGPDDADDVTLSTSGLTIGEDGLKDLEWDTDDDGDFEETGKEASISLTHGGVKQIALRGTVGDDATGDLDHDVEASPEPDQVDPDTDAASASVSVDLGTEVTGTVRDGLDDEAIEGDRIEVTANPDSGSEITAETDSDGDFSLLLDPDVEYDLSATTTVDEDFEITNETAVDPSETTDQDLTLEHEYDEGDGSESDPYEIENVEDLQQMRYDLDAHYKLVDDVDASETDEWFDDGGTAKGFDPIGEDSTNSFTGTFDGDGHTITGLFIDREDYVGLFGRVDSSGVQNVGVENVDVSGAEYVGGLVGFSYSGDVTETYTTGNVDGKDFVGSLVGYNDYGDVNESYATSDVNGDSSVGGLVGEVSGDVTESYATGSVSGSADVGGLVGYDDDGTVTDGYWDVDSTGQSSSDGSPDENGLETDEMQGRTASDEVDGLDFADAWWLSLDPDDYPRLRALGDGLNVTIDGTNEPVTEGDTLTVDVTVENPGADSLTRNLTLEADGQQRDDREVTVAGDDSEEITLEWDSESGDEGTHDVEVASESAVHTAKVEVDEDSGGGGGGDGGSSGDDSSQDDGDNRDESRVVRENVDESETRFEVTGGDDEVALDVRGNDDSDDQGETGDGNEPTIDESDRENVALDSLSIRLTEDGQRDFEVRVRDWSVAPDTGDAERDDTTTDGSNASDDETNVTGDGTDPASRDDRAEPDAFLEETGSSAVGYVEVNHTNPDEDIEDVTFQFRVRKAYLEETSVDTDSVALYRDETDRWNELDATHVNETDEYHVFEATSPGLSLFTIGSTRPVFEVNDVDLDHTDIDVGETVTVEATVQNLGGTEGTHEVALTADGERVTETNVDIDARSTETVSLHFDPAEVGQYDLIAGDEAVGTVSVGEANSERSNTNNGDDDEQTDDATGDDDPNAILLVGLLAAALVVLFAVVRLRQRKEEPGE
ncbi:CARDB domain-containing protein [Halorubrum sp. 48-1-W]|uniref:CARDB domain-containing protein n=1 Tax=Halorubrum sp. 48-1-W TaxID=2249761 RepID=UPI000FCA55E1|nr:CARDB domain-containing protein [Halorubrum sp. 48-1-W]